MSSLRGRRNISSDLSYLQIIYRMNNSLKPRIMWYMYACIYMYIHIYIHIHIYGPELFLQPKQTANSVCFCVCWDIVLLQEFYLIKCWTFMKILFSIYWWSYDSCPSVCLWDNVLHLLSWNMPDHSCIISGIKSA